MKKIKILFGVFFLVLFTILPFTPLYAQGLVVERSTERIIIKGKVFYIHQVKKSETLYSIAKAYNISLDTLYAYNPGTNDGIKIDQLLRIPDYKVKAVVKEEKTPEKTKVQETSEIKNVEHTIVLGQTLYGIARIYGLKPADIEKANPGLNKDSLKVGQQIIIPIAHTQDIPKTADYNIHKVQEKETLFSISRLYNTTVDSLIKINQFAENKVIQPGEELRVPKNKPIPAEISSKPEVKTDTIPEKISLNCDSFLARTQQNKVVLSLLLPLFASNTESTSNEQDENANEEKRHSRQKSAFSSQSSAYVEFYQGSLLALEDLKKKKVDITLQVYDTENDSNRLNNVLQKPEFQNSNVVIGPMNNSLMNFASSKIQKNGPFIVSPFSDITNITKANQNIFQVNAGKENLFTETIKHLPDNDTTNIIVVYNANEAESINAGFRNASAQLKDVKATTMWKELNVYHNGFEELVNLLDSMKENIIVSPSTDEIFVSNLLSILESKLVLYRIKVVGLTEWTLFSSIDMNYLFDQQLTYNTPFIIDYDSEPVKRFLKKYRLYFGSEPNFASKQGFNYCMLGYDVTYYFAMGYAQYGIKLPLATLCFDPEMLITQFRFQKSTPTGGMINKTLHKVSYTREYEVLHE